MPINKPQVRHLIDPALPYLTVVNTKDGRTGCIADQVVERPQRLVNFGSDKLQLVEVAQFKSGRIHLGIDFTCEFSGKALRPVA